MYISSEIDSCKEKTVHECCYNINVSQNIEIETKDVFSKFLTINNSYEEICELAMTQSTNETVFSSQVSNNSKLPIF